MLFGVPNRGSDVAHTATGILTLLNTVFNVNRNMIQDLDKKSQRLADIASQFRQVRRENSIPVISFFEQQKYGSGLGLVRIKCSCSSPFWILTVCGYFRVLLPSQTLRTWLTSL